MMVYAKLGQTDIKVSTIALGCMAFAGGSTWGEQDEQDSIAAVKAALDAGINFFDTAEGYGDGYSEEVLGKALGTDRYKAVIATKVSKIHLSKSDVFSACERSLKRLHTDYIDLYQIHWPNWQIPIVETMEALAELKKQGKIRAIGVCNFGPGDLEDLLKTGRIETDQLPYNLLWRVIERDIKPKCVENNIGILSYSSLAQGLLTGLYHHADEFPVGRARTRLFSGHRRDTKHGEQGHEEKVFTVISKIREICVKLGEPMSMIALAWLLKQKGMTSVIVGARNAAQAVQNARAAEVIIPEDLLTALDEATRELKNILGTNIDVWMPEKDSRIR